MRDIVTADNLTKRVIGERVPIVEHLFSPSMPSTAVKTNTNLKRKVKNKSE
jgi:hypothetical protein